MQQPPFRLASASAAIQPGSASRHRASGVDCCSTTEPAATAAPPRRSRLGELDSHIHCSVIGTCLSDGDLRKLLPRFADMGGSRASDVDVHHMAVQFAGAGGAGAKALHKALDDRHATTVKRFGAATDEHQLQALWAQAMKSGDLPGAYWALMTHRFVTPALRQQAFGDVHMLSHLVGAANRADIRRLVSLEQENSELKQHAERQQQRLNEMGAQMGTLRRELAAARTDAVRRESCVTPTEEFAALLRAAEAKDQLVALQTSRRQEAERDLMQRQETERDLRGQLERQEVLIRALHVELTAIEGMLPVQPGDKGSPGARCAALSGKRLVYVGGRPSSAPAIKAVVEAAGGEILFHDGGIEDRKGLLAAALPRADAVVFPVDCVDHDSMSTLKKVSQRHRVAFYPLRNASVASFLACVAQWQVQLPEASGSPSRFCLRHG